MLGDISGLSDLTSKGVFESREVEAAIEWWTGIAEGEDAIMLRALEAFRATVAGFVGDGRWMHGLPLIVESEFRDYVRDYNKDCLPDVDWTVSPFSHVDWDAVAKEERSDYGEVEFNGETILYKTF